MGWEQPLSSRSNKPPSSRIAVAVTMIKLMIGKIRTIHRWGIAILRCIRWGIEWRLLRYWRLSRHDLRGVNSGMRWRRMICRRLGWPAMLHLHLRWSHECIGREYTWRGCRECSAILRGWSSGIGSCRSWVLALRLLCSWSSEVASRRSWVLALRLVLEWSSGIGSCRSWVLALRLVRSLCLSLSLEVIVELV